jgi:hypothetical protein
MQRPPFRGLHGQQGALPGGESGSGKARRGAGRDPRQPERGELREATSRDAHAEGGLPCCGERHRCGSHTELEVLRGEDDEMPTGGGGAFDGGSPCDLNADAVQPADLVP